MKILANGRTLIENLYDIGKIKVEQVRVAIESDLVYPLLRGRDVERWSAHASMHMILTQDPATRTGIPEKRFKREYPHAFAYLRGFEDQLRRRSGFKKYFAEDDPFYSIYNVGEYTFARAKVVWRDMGAEIGASVLVGDGSKPVIPEHHTMFVPCSSEEEAHYVCALLNSAVSRFLISAYTTSTGISTHVLKHLAVPAFDAAVVSHKALASASRQCHTATAAGHAAKVKRCEAKIDVLAAAVWGVQTSDLV